MLLFWQATALCLVTGIVSLVSANTEKTIFIAPKETEVSIQETALAASLAWLTPHSNVKRTYIPVIFPPPEDADRPAGTESWFYLSGMTPGQRHEVRICWAATQPTEFWLDTFTFAEVQENPALNASVERFILSEQLKKQSDGEDAHPEYQTDSDDVTMSPASSSLFLRLIAAADYFTLNETLMQSPEPVHADLILDPFLGNVFPKSLVPVGIYISVIAVMAWFISDFTWKFISNIADTENARNGGSLEQKKKA